MVIGRRWKTTFTDWEAFRDDIIRRTAQIQWEDLTAEQMQQELDRQVTNTSDACLAKQETGKPRRPRWWSSRLDELRREKSKLRKTFQRQRQHAPLHPETQATRRNANRARKAYARAIQKAKGDDWRSFVSEEGNNDPWGPVYRICRGKGAATSIGCFSPR